MLKGVNKTIIEVNNPDSIYFEKAVFYLRPHIRQLPEEISREEIRLYLAEIESPVPSRRHRKLFLAAGAAAAAAAAVLILI